jgi:5'/3'-nucleotidase SurE
MRILITNDDGILAPGLEALYSAVADLGHVDVVAPDDSQSGVGHAISVLKPSWSAACTSTTSSTAGAWPAGQRIVSSWR